MYTYIHTGMCIHTYMHTRIYGKEFTVMTSEKGTCTDAASGGGKRVFFGNFCQLKGCFVNGGEVN
jgi:hypothetical protein